jgi:hypothetical protein
LIIFLLDTYRETGRVYPLGGEPISIVRSGAVLGYPTPGQNRPYLIARRNEFLRMWRYVRAVLRVIGVRKRLIPALKDFQDHTSKDRPARFPHGSLKAELGEPLDYLSSGHVSRDRAGLWIKFRFYTFPLRYPHSQKNGKDYRREQHEQNQLINKAASRSRSALQTT